MEIKVEINLGHMRDAVLNGVRLGLREANVRNTALVDAVTQRVMNRIEYMLCEQAMLKIDHVHSQVTKVEDSPLERAETPLRQKTAALDGANARQVGGQHYKGGIEHWDYVISNQIPYLEAQVIKYVTRWRKKNGLQDLEKAEHFLQKAIEVGKEELRRGHEVDQALNDGFRNHF